MLTASDQPRKLTNYTLNQELFWSPMVHRFYLFIPYRLELEKALRQRSRFM